MTEISLLDLREFIALSANYNYGFHEFSSIALRLALQRVCGEMKIKKFSDFLNAYAQNAALRQAVKTRVFIHPGELLRDIAAWEFVIGSCKVKLADPLCKLLIIDNSGMADSANFFLAARIFDCEVNAEVYWYCSSKDVGCKKKLLLTSKEIETAQANMHAYKIDVSNYLKRDAEKFVFEFNDKIKPAKTDSSISKLLPVTDVYDLIISQNNSLVFNFATHEKYFYACYSAAAIGAGLFFGTKESLINASVFNLLYQPSKEFNYFVKSAY